MAEIEIPDGLMQAWDPVQKKVILVAAPPPGPDRLKLTLRLHDPRERKNAKLAASWVVVDVPREDLALAPAAFAEKYLAPAVIELEHFKIQMDQAKAPSGADAGTTADSPPALDNTAHQSEAVAGSADPPAAAASVPDKP